MQTIPRASLVVTLLSALGCASLPAPVARAATYALPAVESSTLDRVFSAERAAHPGLTGLAMLDTGRESLTARLLLCNLAEHSIDVQSFDWSGDAVGRLVWERLRRAADRGVRVRILVDDMHLGGRNIDALTHPNVELRLVNPFAQRASARVLELLHRFGRLNHRMHNKLFIIDNEVAFVGGRNLADEYFGVHRKFNYRDLDVIAIGAAVGQAEAAFDAYWNHPLSYPNTELGHATPKKRAALLATLDRDLARAARECPYPMSSERGETIERLQQLTRRLSWGPAQVVWDDPERLVGRGGMPPGAPTQAFTRLVDATRRELVAEAAYFVPDPSLTLITRLAQRGVHVRVLTNSLPSTDLAPVHAHYATARLPMLTLGVQLYELRPDAAMRSRHVASRARPGRLGLHAKVTIFDRSTVFIGSFNLDPRSRELNTEVALVAENPELAEQILARIDDDLAPQNSWALAIGERGGLIWRHVEGAVESRRGFQPGGAWRQVQEFLFAILPIRDLM